jgi:TonB family protein
MVLPRRACLVPLVLWLALRPAAGADDNAQKQDKRGEGRNDEAAGSKPREEADEPVYDPGPGVTPPRLIHQVQPERRESPGFRLSGKVVISMVVSSAGVPANVSVVKGIDKDVDQSVIAAVKEWRFTPGRKDGKAVAVRVTAEVHFNDL